MRTNIVLDEKLVARAMKKAGVGTMRETIDIALRDYVSKPDYGALLALADEGTIAPGYDPKAGDRPSQAAAETGAAYRVRRKARARASR